MLLGQSGQLGLGHLCEHKPGTESKGVVAGDVELAGDLSRQGWETKHRAGERPYWVDR